MSGCLIAALAVGGVAIVGVIVVGVFLAKVWGSFSAEDKKTLKAVADETERSGTAPGMSELGEIGCLPNMIEVATMPELTRMHQTRTDAAALDVPYVLECHANPLMTPSCEKVAKTYMSAVKRAPGPFLLTVTNSRQKALCTEKHDASGAKVD